MALARRQQRALAAIVLFLLWGWMALEIVKVGVAREAARAGLGSIAHQFRPSNPRGAALMASLRLAAGEPSAAEGLARQAVDLSPIDVVAVRTLAEIRSRAAPGTGDRLMLLAAQLSWRDRPTQAWVLERALIAGEMAIAMNRAEALARLRPDNALVFGMLRLLAQDPEGQRLLVDALARQPVWRTYFLLDGTPKSPQQLEALAQTLEALKRTAAPPTVQESRDAIDSLVLAGRPERGYQLYVRLFGTGATTASLYRDSGFERRDTDYQPAQSNTLFDWRVRPSEGGQAAVEDEMTGGRNRALFASSGGQADLLTRFIVLNPGRYRFSYRVRAEEPRAPAAFRWRVRCGEQGPVLLDETIAPVSGQAWERRSAGFLVPQTGCTSLTIGLAPNPSERATPYEAWYDDVTVVEATEQTRL